MTNRTLVSEQRKYLVLNVQAARQIARIWLERAHLENVVGFGLPEVDDRYHIWRVPLINKANQEKIGEVAIDAYSSLILEDKSTSPEILEARLLGRIHYRTFLHTDNANRFQHIEHNWNKSLLIQEMLKQSQAQLKQTQIAAIRPMNDFDPVISHGQRAQENDPDVGQRGGDHQARQPSGIRQVTLVQMKAAAFLIRKEGLDAEAFGIPAADLST